MKLEFLKTQYSIRSYTFKLIILKKILSFFKFV